MAQEPREPPTPEAIEAGIRHHRRAKRYFDEGDILIRFCQRHYKRRAQNGEDALLLMLEHGFKRQDVDLSKMIAWASLEQSAMEGDIKAAQTIVQYALGLPDKPFSETVQTMTNEQLLVQMETDYLALGVAPAIVEQLLLAHRESEVR
jgi:hypothetical protein